MKATAYMKRMKREDKVFTAISWVIALGMAALILFFLWVIINRGLLKITPGFLTAPPQELDAGGGIGPFLFNSFYVLVLSLIFSVPVGIGSGIFLAEYAPDNKITQYIRMCVEALASVPSIVFGLFGMAVFVDSLQIGLTILGAAVSLALLNLPVLTRVTEQALKTVPFELREASMALGATRFQSLWTVVLPAAMSGIITGIGLVAGRAFGESAVIILTAGTTSSGNLWDFNLFSPGATLAVHLWYVQSEAIVPDAREIADKASAVLVMFALGFNLLLRLPLMISRRMEGLR